MLSVTIPIAVGITVAIPVTVAVRAMLVNRPVQDQAHVTQLAFLVEFLHFGKGTAVHSARTDDIDRQVGHPVDDHCIGNHTGRYVVQDDIIIPLTQLGDQSLQPVSQQEFSRVRRNRTGMDDIQLVAQLVLPDDLIDIVDTAGQISVFKTEADPV